MQTESGEYDHADAIISDEFKARLKAFTNNIITFIMRNFFGFCLVMEQIILFSFLKIHF